MKKRYVFFALCTALACSFGLYGAEGQYENSSSSPRYFQPSYERKHKDRQIEQEINYYLSRRPAYRNTRLNTSVSNGVVYLQGTTDSETTKAEISRDIRRIPGVKRVDNELKVERDHKTTSQSSSTTTMQKKPLL